MPVCTFNLFTVHHHLGTVEIRCATVMSQEWHAQDHVLTDPAYYQLFFYKQLSQPDAQLNPTIEGQPCAICHHAMRVTFVLSHNNLAFAR